MFFSDQPYEHNGITRTVREWCDLLNISYHTVKSRHTRGALTFDKLFKITPIQLRHVNEVCAKQGEDLLRNVNILELLFDTRTQETILAVAKANSPNGYSVRETLRDLVVRGIRDLNKELKELENERDADKVQRIANFPNGIPDQVISGNTYGWKVTEPRQDVVYTTPFKPMTPEEAADIGDW